MKSIIEDQHQAKLMLALLTAAITLSVALSTRAYAARPAPGFILNDDEKGVQHGNTITATVGGGGKGEESVTVQRIEREDSRDTKDGGWLGVGTEEVNEALSSQLKLSNGEGLVVSYVSSNSPAYTAGLQKNDVLVQFEEQLLVHPAQLRKLVQARKPGDQVRLVYIRAGVRKNLSVALGKSPGGFFPLFGDDGAWSGSFVNLARELPTGDVLTRVLAEKGNVEVRIKEAMEEARKAAEGAVRSVPKVYAFSTTRNSNRELEELAKNGVEIDKDATVTIKSRSREVKTIIKTDDEGKYLLIADPTKRVIVYDKDGKLIFEGEVETKAQLEKVPASALPKVQELLEQINKGKAATD